MPRQTRTFGRRYVVELQICLNAEGLKQATEAAEYYSSTLAEVKSICVSPLSRALKTAEIFSNRLKIPTQIVPELREWILGDSGPEAI